MSSALMPVLSPQNSSMSSMTLSSMPSMSSTMATSMTRPAAAFYNIKTPALPRRTPVSSTTLRTTVSSPVIPLSLPPPFSLAVETDGTASPNDFLLAMVEQAISVKKCAAEASSAADENEPPVGCDQMNFLVSMLTACSTPLARKKRAPKKQLTSTSASPTLSTPESTNSVTLTALLNGTTPLSGQKRKRNAPLTHEELVCANCGTTETTLWRRNEAGSIECNSCSLYFKKRGVPRPLTLQNRLIYKRSRKSEKDQRAEEEKIRDQGFDLEKILQSIAPPTQNEENEIDQRPEEEKVKDQDFDIQKVLNDIAPLTEKDENENKKEESEN